MTNEKYTARDFFTAILAFDGIGDAERAYAESALAKLDERNDKRRNTLTKEQEANIGIKADILAYITAHTDCVASEIAEALTLSTQKVSALCRQLMADGSIESVEVKGKSGKVKGYHAI